MQLKEIDGQLIIYRDSSDRINKIVDGLSEFHVSEQAANELREKYTDGDYWVLIIGTWNDKVPQEYEWEIEDNRGIILRSIVKGIIKYENNLPILASYSEREC